MLELQTERLRILALERDHLALLLHHPDQFDKDMTLNSPAPGTQNPLAVSHEEMGRRVDEDPERYYWYTDWKIILREERTVVGELCFLGAPDAEGCVEVIYSIAEPYQHQGIMTECLRVMITWAFRQPEVRALVAEVPRDNFAAARVMEKAGAEKLREGGSSCWWKICKRG
ncbi:MAG TPA: GNAT family N-acetyltransferase, partial [Synergistaceae bacterium]|nr:GNAT family N-acetyltransferase [Synergistaceae bacterium]HQK24804.1 GNAT family N-acetyltransferase [Synergistaceae bacterium]